MDKIKRIEIMDMGVKKHFQIRLFKALEGLDFIDKLASVFKNNENFSIKPFIKDLLPLASLINQTTGEIVQDLTWETAGALFESPMAIIDLAKEILDHQMVFTKDSAIFQAFPKQVKNMFTRQPLV